MSVIRIRKSSITEVFLQNENFVGTVRNEGVSVPRGSAVFLFFFDSFSLLSFFIFKCVMKIILRIISAAILLIQTRWDGVRAEVQGANFDKSAGKRRN